MTTYTDLELWAIVSAVYHDKNEFVTIEAGRNEHGLRQQIGGLQAEIIHNGGIEPVEKVGQPEEVFVTPRDVFESTVYNDVGTVRQRLEDLAREDLLECHGDVLSNPEGERHLYIPTTIENNELISHLHELSGRPIPSSLTDKNLEHVVPTDFSHEGKGKFIMDGNEDIKIDVSDPDGGDSIRRYVEKQLLENGLTADVNNFYYSLRKRAGLVD